MTTDAIREAVARAIAKEYDAKTFDCWDTDGAHISIRVARNICRSYADAAIAAYEAAQAKAAAPACEHHWVGGNDGAWCTICKVEQPAPVTGEPSVEAMCALQAAHDAAIVELRQDYTVSWLDLLNKHTAIALDTFAARYRGTPGYSFDMNTHAGQIDNLRAALSVIDTRDPELHRLLAERNMIVTSVDGGGTPFKPDGAFPVVERTRMDERFAIRGQQWSVSGDGDGGAIV